MELSTVQAALLVSVSEQTIRDHIRAGRLRARRHGLRPRYKILPADLRAFAARYGYVLDEQTLAAWTRIPAQPEDVSESSRTHHHES